MENNIKILRVMIEDNSFSLRKAVAVLRALGHDSRVVGELEQWAEKPFAPRGVEKSALELCRMYYHNLPKTNIEPKNTEGVKLEDKTDDPIIILKLRQEQRDLRDERRALHMTLEETEDLKLRGEKVHKIRQITERVDRIFEQLDMYDEKGILPAVAAVVEGKEAIAELLDLYNKKTYLPQRICRLKAWLKDTTLGIHKKERYKKELAIKEEELKSVVQKLATVEQKP
jgi:hypothetical protein